MIEAENLQKTFNASGRGKNEPVVAAKDVSFTAQNGEITGLLGANGAGKSTTLRIISGLVKPDEGTVLVDTVDSVRHSLNAKKQIGYMPHDAGLYGRLTARENIAYFAKLSGMTHQRIAQRTNELVELLDMGEFCDRRSEGFSQGQKTKVALARALIHSPKNLILDEPTNGLDVLATRNLREILASLKNQGHCILLSSHIMQEVTHLCDRVAIIDRGFVVDAGSIDDIVRKAKASNFEDAFVSLISDARQSEKLA